MKLRTSYFNGAVLKKDITRFCPIWALYTIFSLLVLMAFDADTPDQMAYACHDILPGMSVVNFFYAGIVAVMLFGDLYNPRMCNALHAFPMRREGWFVTHLTSGMLFCLVPNLLIVILTLFTLESMFYIAFLWLAVMLLQYLFFFGVAAFSVLCAGNRLGAAAVYGLINFLSLLVYYLAYTFYVPLLYGVEIQAEPFLYFSPCLQMADHNYFNYTHYWGGFGGFLPEQWLYLFAVAGIGIALLAAAVLIYRRRNLETAGDFLSLRCLHPVFLVVFTVGAGAVMHALGDLFSYTLSIVFPAIGLVVGFFIGRMLLMRTVKVFQPKAFLGFFLLVAAMGASMLLTALDPLGITTRIPSLQSVKSVTISTSTYYNSRDLTLEDPKDIGAILGLHQSILETREEGGSTADLYLEYELAGGSKLSRHYKVLTESDNGKALNKYLSSWQCVFGADDWTAFKKSVGEIYAEDIDGFPKEGFEELLEALYKDCEAGRMAQNWSFHPKEEYKSSVDIVTYDGNTRSDYISLIIYDSCTNTLEVLEKYQNHEKTE